MRKLYEWDNQPYAKAIWKRMLEIALADILRTTDKQESVNYKHVILKNWFSLDNQECVKVTDWLRTTASWATTFEMAILYNRGGLTTDWIRNKLKRSVINPNYFQRTDKQIKAPTLDIEILNKIKTKIVYITWMYMDYQFFWKAQIT